MLAERMKCDGTDANHQIYDSNCYLPLAGFLTFHQEPDQYLFSYLLRPGNADAKEGCFGLLKRVLPKLRQTFPGAVIRLDSGFSGPDIYEFMEAQRCQYVVAMAKNSVLKTFSWARFLGCWIC